MAVRAMMRCNSIKLSRTSVTNPKYLELAQKESYGAAQAKAEEDGEPISIEFDQPTIELVADYGSGEENRAWSAATPMANLQMTITNPDAAETFELGQQYFVDFSPVG